MTDADGAAHQISHPVTVTSPNEITYRGAAGYTGNVTTASVQVPPTVQAGDVLVLFASLNLTTSSVTGPSGVTGWTAIANVANGTQRTMAWSKTASPTDSGQTLWLTFDAYTKVSLQVTGYGRAALGMVGQRSDTTSRPRTPRRRSTSVWMDRGCCPTGPTSRRPPPIGLRRPALSPETNESEPAAAESQPSSRTAERRSPPARPAD